MYRKLIIALIVCIVGLCCFGQTKVKLEPDNSKAFHKIYFKETDLFRIRNYATYLDFFKAQLLVEATIKTISGSAFYKTMGEFPLSASQIVALQSIDSNYTAKDRLSKDALENLLKKMDWEKQLKQLLTILLKADTTQIIFCFKRIEPPALTGVTFTQKGKQLPITDKFLDQGKFIQYIGGQPTPRGYHTSNIWKNQPPDCICSKIGKCTSSDYPILVRGNNWVIGNTLFLGLSIAAVDSNVKEFKLKNKTTALNTFLDSLLRKQYQLDSFKIIIYNAYQEGVDLPEYHLDLFFTPFPFQGKYYALFNSPLAVHTWGNIQKMELDSYTTHLSYFKNYITKKALVDSLIMLPSIFLKQGTNPSEIFSFSNCIINNQKDSLAFFLPDFEKFGNNPILDSLVENSKNEISSTLSKKFGKSAAVRFMDFQPYAESMQGFLHCNFLPLYK